MSLKLKYILPIIALPLAACSHRDSDEPSATGSRVIMIDTVKEGIDMWEAVTTSRAASLEAPELDIQTVGVFAAKGTDDQLVFDNQRFYYRNSYLIEGDANLTYLQSTWPETNNWIYTPEKAWTSGANYVFVAYSPHCPDTDVSIQRNAENDFTELIWTGLSSIYPSDIMVSTCKAYTALGSNNPAVGLKLEHLMARLRFCFKQGDTPYANLRTIKVKQMKVDYPDSRSMTLKVSYSKAGSIYTPTYRWERGEPGTGNSLVTLHNENDVESITLAKGGDYQPLASLYYEPGDQLHMFTIEVTYDVYDSKGTLLRANDRAVSSINMLHSFEAGNYYDIKIRIEPSYLYVLSDQEPDSDGELIIP